MGHAYAEGAPIPPELRLPSPVPLCPRPDKIRYKDEAAVELRIARLGNLAGRPALHGYRCVCGWWHVSHMSRSEYAKVRNR